MRKTRVIIAAATGLIGVALLIRGVTMGGLWPLSAQPLIGVLFIIVAWVRWRTL